jgi:hypothetical protein
MIPKKIMKKVFPTSGAKCSAVPFNVKSSRGGMNDSVSGHSPGPSSWLPSWKLVTLYNQRPNPHSYRFVYLDSIAIPEVYSFNTKK